MGKSFTQILCSRIPPENQSKVPHVSVVYAQSLNCEHTIQSISLKRLKQKLNIYF